MCGGGILDYCELLNSKGLEHCKYLKGSKTFPDQANTQHKVEQQHQSEGKNTTICSSQGNRRTYAYVLGNLHYACQCYTTRAHHELDWDHGTGLDQ